MGSWNYRVMRHSYQVQDGTKEYWFVLHQVSYDERGEIRYWTTPEDRGDYPYGDTEAELQNDVREMVKAFDLPVLDYTTGKEIDG